MIVGNVFTFLCVVLPFPSFAVATADTEGTCPAGIDGCKEKGAPGAKLLQRRADVRRATVSEQELIQRGPRPPYELFQDEAIAEGNVTGNLTADGATPLSRGLLRREGLAGEALGEGAPAAELLAETAPGGGGTVNASNALKVLNKNAEQMTPEEALRNGLLTTVDTIASLTGGNAEDEDCTAGTGGTPCYEGDMVPGGDDQLRLFQMLAQLDVKRLNGKYAGNLWTGANVSYCFAADVSESMRKLMQTAIESIKRAVPCMIFTDVGNPKGYKGSDSKAEKACGATPSVFIQSTSGGCWAHVGMLTKAQLNKWSMGAGALNLASPGCQSLGTAIHEMLHTLGQTHEQSRPDRDAYLNIYWDNIKEGKEKNFNIKSKGHVDLDYDFLSIMQYGSHAFSANEEATIGPKDGLHDGKIGQRVGMSNSDAEQLAMMYKDEVSSCAAGTVADNKGCTDTGSTDCDSLQACGSGTSMEDCCACGAGIEHQCWSGSECRQPEELPMDPAYDYANCIVDRTYKFPHHPCVIQNECNLKLKIRCSGRPGYFYNHDGSNRYKRPPFVQLCTEKSECTFELREG